MHSGPPRPGALADFFYPYCKNDRWSSVRESVTKRKYHEKRFRAMLQNVQTGNEIESFYQSLIRSAEKILG